MKLDYRKIIYSKLKKAGKKPLTFKELLRSCRGKGFEFEKFTKAVDKMKKNGEIMEDKFGIRLVDPKKFVKCEVVRLNKTYGFVKNLDTDEEIFVVGKYLKGAMPHDIVLVRTFKGEGACTEGEVMSIDGNTGNVYVGAIPTVDATISGDFAVVMGWADSIRKLHVRTNADTPRDAANAVRLGAEGIGLTRTEHMFFDADRIPAMREMILSTDVEHRAAALAKLLPMQRGDFEGIFKAMEGRPVTIRLLDPPLHEFLPTADEDIKALADEMGLTFDYVKGTILSLHENNPMMGFRGCRLPVKYPEIAEMQTRAIIEAAINVKNECGYDIVPEIMIPLTCEFKELKYVSNIVKATAEAVKAEKSSDLKYLVGTMIEIPRAALTADEIAKEAEFFSFGTNDLTQMTFGFSRDDAGSFLPSYYEKQIFDNDPFERIDQVGVGKLVDMAVKLGRATRPDIHLGICGEHGGEPSSVDFCHRVGLDYVSCSPFRVPIARMAAAQAQIKNPRA